MIPEELFKRKHYGTPQFITLIIVNAILVALVVPSFKTCGSISWLFWVFIVLLAAYNVYTVRRFRDEFNKITSIAYAIVMIIIVISIVIILSKNGCAPSA